MSIETRIDGNLADIFHLASWLRNTLVNTYESAADDFSTMGKIVSRNWKGETADAAAEWTERAARSCREMTDEARRCAIAVEAFAETLQKLHAEAEDCVATLLLGGLS